MKKQILAKVSPWILAAACTLLTLIIGVFALSNYQREKQLMTEALLQQGITIARFVNSSARASLRDSLRSIRMNMWQWTDHVQQAITNSAEQPGLLFLGLIDESGNILACSVDELVGTKIDQSSFGFINEISKIDGRNGYRFEQKKDNQQKVFQIGASYHPFGRQNFISRMQGRGFAFPDRQGSMRGPQRMPNAKIMEQLENLVNEKFFLLVELDLSDYNKAIQGKLLQIVSLALVLLLVGIGGWLSLLTLQGLKGSQIRLRQIRQYTDLLVSSLPIGLIATADDGTIRIFNKSAENMVEIEADNVLGELPEKVLPIELANELKQGDGENPGVVQKEIYCCEGSNFKRSLMTISLPVMDSKDRFAGITLLIQDVSRVKELQQELRRNERLAALGKMAAGVAHELRNPLSSIKGLALLLKGKNKADTDAETTADILVQEVERLNRSIGELLDYARPQKLELKAIDICDVVEKAVSLIAVDVESARIDLQLSCDTGLRVKGDRDKLNQVFLNLLLNSLQAIEEGGRLGIRAEREGNMIICTIEDDGCGIDEEHVTRVFDPYFTTKKDGTGLGLAMSAKIIEEHSGSIEFKSVLEKGTTVTVYLPVFPEDGIPQGVD